MSWQFPRFLACSMAFLVGSLAALVPAGEIGWIEDFALGTDRGVALKQLIPGTEDFYYYHCLHYQNSEQWDKVDEMLKSWVNRYQWTGRAIEIQNRQALLTYSQNPQRTLELIRNRLNLQFNHQREQLNQKPNLPTSLDGAILSTERLNKDAFGRFPNTLQGFEDAALDWLVAAELNPEQRRHLLQRLQRPDYPNLPALVVADLNHVNSGGFGQWEIHRRLLLAQLNECLKLKPDLLNQQHFVNAYLVRLQPSNDANWRQDQTELGSYLERLWSFVRTLAPAHNSLKAHVLYHQLVLDRQQGRYDVERFTEYLKLPKHTVYVEQKYMEPIERRQHACNLEQDFSSATLLPPVGNDEPLVRSYLMHFFVDAADYKAFSTYVNDLYLKRVFAETKIVGGLGDAEKWYSLLSPEEYRQLKERIDLDFAFTNKTEFGIEEPVALDLFVKNVDTLIVKVFEVNTRNFYRENLREIDTDVNLDGLVANEEKTHTFKEPSLRRVRHHFEFPALDKRGVYVIDFIGNGKASRALVRKGKLRFVSRTSVAGQIFTVFDENRQLAPKATLWMGGTLYKADKDGEIVVPFTNEPGRQPVVVSDGGFSSLQFYEGRPEQYQLSGGFYVDREELISRRTALLLVRPQLLLDGNAVTRKVLENVRLSITSTDLDGVVSTTEVPNFKLFDDRESTHEFQVPQRLSSIRFSLLARVQNRSLNQKQDLAAEQTFSLNEIDRTDKTEDLHFARVDQTYVVDLLGKTGEAKADRPVNFAFKLRDYTQPVNVSLQSDPRGRVTLGPLPGVETVTATSPQGVSHTWSVRKDEHTYTSVVHASTAEPIQVPYMGRQDEPARSELSLLELRGDSFAFDRFENIAVEGGLLKISKLPPGDYSLLLKPSGTHIQVRVTDGPERIGYALGSYRGLELKNTKPLQLEQISVTDELLKLKLQNATSVARVHVFATRFQPAYSAYANLAREAGSPLYFTMPRVESKYIAGRDIGDEYRYIIDRKFSRKFPGNMLERPSLLLNPWAIRSTETGQQVAQGGEAFGGVGAMKEQLYRGEGRGSGAIGQQADFANLDFLAESSLVQANLAADKDGVLEIKRKDLGPHQELIFVAVDPQNAVSRVVTLPETKASYLDLRLAKGLNPKEHFTQQKRISVLTAGQELVINDITSTRFELYDTLSRVFMLYAALNNDPKLSEFGFVRNWDSHSQEQKEQFYKKFASHELHFFVAKKDPAFFEKALLPYLANKKEKQFLDRWLIGENLGSYAMSWDFEQLNTLERILLSQRIEGDGPVTARLLREQFELLPPDPDRFNHLFETALKGNSLDVEDTLGLKAALDAVEEEKVLPELLEKSAAEMPAEPTNGAIAGDEARAARPPAPSAAPAKPGAALRDQAASGKKQESQNLARRRSGGRQRFDQAKDKSDAESDDFYSDETTKLAAVMQFYRKLDKTMEWVESNYYHLPIDQQTPALIAVNAFWKDYAAHDPTKPFVATSTAEATHNFHEMLAALALLDLPFQAEEHKTKFDGVKMTLTAGSPMLVYHEEIQPASKVAEHTPILVSQNFFRHGDRHRIVGGEQVDKFVTEEFLVDVVYGCHIVVTNPTSSRKKVEVLLQVPTGALPVQNGQYTRSMHLDLEPYHTQTLEYYFYFPAPGKFAHYPVQVASGGEVLAFADAFTFNVVRELTNIDKESWDYISQHGSGEDVLNYLKTQNVLQVNLDRIAWRMQDKEYFKTVIGLLTARHLYNNTLWSYGVKHDDAPTMRQFLQFAGDFVAQCGDWLESPLLKIDPIVRKTYEQMDYRPLVNARVGQLGRKREILNDRFSAQYQRLLKILSYRPELDSDELMTVTYYMLLQDRVEDALGFYTRVDEEKLATRLQYDYFTAYLGFSLNKPNEARQIAAKYAKYPVESWREAFANVVNQADEVSKPDVIVADSEDRTQVQTQLAASTAALEFTVESQKVKLNYQNLRQVHVNYYLMDIELLFSRNPFVQGDSKQFNNILPNATQTIDLPEKGTTFEFALPKEFATSNVLVEITGAGASQSQPYYSNSLRVQMIESYGQVRVTHGKANQPLSKVYVKVYARMQDGSVQFYKDGYTDLRGRFDYTSLNTNELDYVDKFALLVLSDEYGAVVREAKPPKR